MFPTREQVRARVEMCKTHPEMRPPSNDYCVACLETGLAHCSEVDYCGARLRSTAAVDGGGGAVNRVPDLIPIQVEDQSRVELVTVPPGSDLTEGARGTVVAAWTKARVGVRWDCDGKLRRVHRSRLWVMGHKA